MKLPAGLVMLDLIWFFPDLLHVWLFLFLALAVRFVTRRYLHEYDPTLGMSLPWKVHNNMAFHLIIVIFHIWTEYWNEWTAAQWSFI